MSSFQEYFYTQVGNKIRKYRVQKGLSQEKLSEILGLNDKYIGHIERQERNISIKVLIKILDYFKIPPHEFFNF